ncbi:ATP-binding protein [Cellulomonas sp. NPDC055163]
MSETTLHRTTGRRTAADLSARAGAVALAVAAVIDERCSPESEAPRAAAFLREWAASVATVRVPSSHDAPTPLDRLTARFGLSLDEQELLVLAGLPEEHEGLAATFRSLHPNAEPRPTAGLAALLLGGSPQVRAELCGVLVGGRAARHGLLRLEGAGPFFERSLVLADDLWPTLAGADAWPASVPRVGTAGPPPGLAAWLDAPGVRACVDVVARGARVLLVVAHDDVAVALGRADAIAEAAGACLVAAAVEPDDGARVRLVLAHAVARGAVPVLMLPARDGSAAALAVGDHPGPVIAVAPPGTVRPGPDRAVLAVDCGPVPQASVRAAWQAAVPALNGRARTVAARHPLDPAVTAQLALDLAVLGHDPDPDRLSDAVRNRTGVELPSAARLVAPAVGWDQLVLPADALLQLSGAVQRLEQQETVLEDWGLRERAQAVRGARLLFVGPPGTGKSLAAAALATAAHTDLMVVDVSRLVSKWLGETEKNVSAVFDAAERTRAVLLFDEADALFGTRTEISDAHDRYANLETAHLLQRIERFEGLVVLTSNLRQNIDPAFTRRLDVVVEFPLPDVTGRAELWRRCLPTGATVASTTPPEGSPVPERPAVVAADVDLVALARLYPVPGGWIRNAALTAAFSASAAGAPITQSRLVDAVRREYLKASTPFPGEPPRRRDDHA